VRRCDDSPPLHDQVKIPHLGREYAVAAAAVTDYRSLRLPMKM
jgi:hypothetical protein